jgi:hypothetical protein
MITHFAVQIGAIIINWEPHMLKLFASQMPQWISIQVFMYLGQQSEAKPVLHMRMADGTAIPCKL